MTRNYGLGRGLSSLIPQKRKSSDGEEIKIKEPQKDFNYFGGSPQAEKDKTAPAMEEGGVSASGGGVLEIAVSDISANPFQPRKDFNEVKLQELAESIKEHGIIQPITVSKNGREYEIIAGERRFQAAKMAGLSKIPVIVKQADNQKKLELAVVENIQRENLNPVEEAKSYLRLVEDFDLGQEEIARKLGKSRSVIANKLRLLNLPVEIQRSLIEGKITEGHAKAILAIDNPEKQRALYELIIKNNLTVRQTEDKTKEVSVRTHKRTLSIDPETKNMEDNLSQTLGTKVKIKKSGGGGRIVIEYYSREELDNILSKIK